MNSLSAAIFQPPRVRSSNSWVSEKCALFTIDGLRAFVADTVISVPIQTAACPRMVHGKTQLRRAIYWHRCLQPPHQGARLTISESKQWPLEQTMALELYKARGQTATPLQMVP